MNKNQGESNVQATDRRELYKQLLERKLAQPLYKNSRARWTLNFRKAKARAFDEGVFVLEPDGRRVPVTPKWAVGIMNGIFHCGPRKFVANRLFHLSQGKGPIVLTRKEITYLQGRLAKVAALGSAENSAETLGK
jgi:hypothetical protein